MSIPDWANWYFMDENVPDSFEIDGVRLVLTCAACPEQYDAYIGEERAAYLRLRWGHFRVDVPDCGGETIYNVDLGDGLSGCFSPEERVIHLPLAIKALKERHEQSK